MAFPRRHIIAVLASCLLLALAPVLAADRPLRLASLEWAPYVGARLPSEGLTAAIVKAVARQAGLTSQISYAPWSRAVQVGSQDPAYAGYFPAYYVLARKKTCHLSGVLGHSVTGFAYLKEQPLQWQTLADLGSTKIGIVQDYANGDEFDALRSEGRLNTDTAPSDVSNLRKLLAGRVAVAVIDQEVLRYLLANEPSLQAAQGRILFHPRVLTNSSLHICFQRSAQGRELQLAFDRALARVDIRQLENAYFRQLDSLHP